VVFGYFSFLFAFLFLFGREWRRKGFVRDLLKEKGCEGRWEEKGREGRWEER
jgi:hypothetical protein